MIKNKIILLTSGQEKTFEYPKHFLKEHFVFIIYYLVF